jgi:molybdopterin/thiamine biosynthesis adenylyltransferase
VEQSDRREVKTVDLSRYAKQTSLATFGVKGQESLGRSGVLVVGVGGLGSWVAELLVRAGVGRIRLVDDDSVAISNIHRQAMYTERDAAARTLKIEAAARRLREINGGVEVETVYARMDRLTAERLMQDVDVVVDGTDNFETRFVLNDCAMKLSKPWVFAGVLGTKAQMMTIVPGRTPCLRCLMDSPPTCDGDQCCGHSGVLGAAVAVAASFEATEALKILSGHSERINPYLLVFDVWDNTIKQIDISTPRADCPCCVHKEFEFLEP